MNFDKLFAHLDTDQNGKVEMIEEMRGLLFGDMHTQNDGTQRLYCEILDHRRLINSATE